MNAYSIQRRIYYEFLQKLKSQGFRVIRVNHFEPWHHGFNLIFDLPALWFDGVFRIYQHKRMGLFSKYTRNSSYLFFSKISGIKDEENVLDLFSDDQGSFFSDFCIQKKDIFNDDRYLINFLS